MASTGPPAVTPASSGDSALNVPKDDKDFSRTSLGKDIPPPPTSKTSGTKEPSKTSSTPSQNDRRQSLLLERLHLCLPPESVVISSFGAPLTSAHVFLRVMSVQGFAFIPLPSTLTTQVYVSGPTPFVAQLHGKVSPAPSELQPLILTPWGVSPARPMGPVEDSPVAAPRPAGTSLCPTDSMYHSQSRADQCPGNGLVHSNLGARSTVGSSLVDRSALLQPSGAYQRAAFGLGWGSGADSRASHDVPSTSAVPSVTTDMWGTKALVGSVGFQA